MSDKLQDLMICLMRKDEEGSAALLKDSPELKDQTIPDLTGNGREYRPLHMATFTKQHGLMGTLLELGADVNVAEATHKGWTALHFAAQNNDLEAVELLLKHDAKVDIADKDGCTALHWTAINDGHETAQLLLSAGADKNVKDKDGKTPRQHAEDQGLTVYLEKAGI